MYKALIFLFLCVLTVNVATEGRDGDICLLPNSQEGRCTYIKGCKKAIDDSEFRRATKICGFNASEPIVCCPRNEFEDTGNCPPVTPRRPDMKFGKKAFEKCLEYQEEVVFPCTEDGVSPLTPSGKIWSRKGGCHDPPPLIVGSDGIDASRGQFPHMALLGYGTNITSAEWSCGGTIISDRFILTAGHCTYHKLLGQVAFARLGILKRSDPWLVSRLYSVARVISHPGYRPPHKYNDIALLQTEQRIVFVNKFVSPACLDVEDDEKDDSASATGWGALGETAGIANVLQIMDLTRFSIEECSEHYKEVRLLTRGIDNSTQMCYGHRFRPTDTCQGDSGGPLQTEYRPVQCMHKVVGVTSFGKSCGRTAQPGIYTRVRPYVPWIEAQVWPSLSGY